MRRDFLRFLLPALLAFGAGPAAAANLVGLLNSDSTHKALVVFNPATGGATQLGGLISAGAMPSGAGAINATTRQLYFAAQEPVSGEFRLFTVDLTTGTVLTQPALVPPANYESLPVWLLHDGARLLGLVQRDATRKSLVQINTASGAMTVIGAELSIGETWGGSAAYNSVTGITFFAATDGVTTSPRLYRLTSTGAIDSNAVISVASGLDPVPLALLFDSAFGQVVLGLWRDPAQSRIAFGKFLDVAAGTTTMLADYAVWGDSSGVAAINTPDTRIHFAANDANLGEPRRLVSVNLNTGAQVDLMPVSNSAGLDNTPLWLGAYTAASPGRVPDGTDGDSPLQMSKSSGEDLVLQWATSCSSGATDYAVYEGTLGTFYSHAPLACTTGGTLGATVMPAAASSYYLVVPVAAGSEGSYGTDSSGAEIPAAVSGCYAPLDLTTCS